MTLLQNLVLIDQNNKSQKEKLKDGVIRICQRLNLANTLPFITKCIEVHDFTNLVILNALSALPSTPLRHPNNHFIGEAIRRQINMPDRSDDPMGGRQRLIFA